MKQQLSTIAASRCACSFPFPTALLLFRGTNGVASLSRYTLANENRNERSTVFHCLIQISHPLLPLLLLPMGSYLVVTAPTTSRSHPWRVSNEIEPHLLCPKRAPFSAECGRNTNNKGISSRNASESFSPRPRR